MKLQILTAIITILCFSTGSVLGQSTTKPRSFEDVLKAHEKAEDESKKETRNNSRTWSTGSSVPGGSSATYTQVKPAKPKQEEEKKVDNTKEEKKVDNTKEELKEDDTKEDKKEEVKKESSQTPSSVRGNISFGSARPSNGPAKPNNISFGSASSSNGPSNITIRPSGSSKPKKEEKTEGPKEEKKPSSFAERFGYDNKKEGNKPSTGSSTSPRSSSTGSSNYNPRSGSGYSARTYDTADQVLGPYKRTVTLNISTTNQRKYKYGIEFSDGAKFFGKASFTSRSQKVKVRFGLTVYKTIIDQKRGQVGEIVAYENTKKVTKTNSPKVYVGGPYDIDCEYPVLAADFHGTLQVKTNAEVDAVDALIEKYNMPIFVVSTSGSAAQKELDRINFKNTDMFLVLDNEDGVGYKQNEKAARIKKQLVDAGVCVVGFVGDSPEKEGDATIELEHIPYFGVNLGQEVSHYKNVTENITHKECVLKKNYPKAYKPKENTKCQGNYKEQNLNTVTCQKIRVQYQRTWHNPYPSESRTYTQEKKQYQGRCPSKPFGHGRNNYGNYHYVWKQIAAQKGRQCTIAEKYSVYNDKKTCKQEYDYKERTETKTSRKAVYRNARINLDKYPEGSTYAPTWEELTTKIEPVIRKATGIL